MLLLFSMLNDHLFGKEALIVLPRTFINLCVLLSLLVLRVECEI